ncbi:MAG: chaperone NapD [Desulfurivibrio sp.]
MLVASGYVEVNEENDLNEVKAALSAKNIEITNAREEKIVFLIERDHAREVKAALDSLKDIPGVRTVYLAYYSLECSDQEKDELLA